MTRGARAELAAALAEVRANMGITAAQRQKQGLERMLGTLQQLREAAHLHDALRCLCRSPCACTLILRMLSRDTHRQDTI